LIDVTQRTIRFSRRSGSRNRSNRFYVVQQTAHH